MEVKNARSLYYIELILLKVLPVIIAICYFIATVLSYFNIETFFLSQVSGISILPLVFLYISSCVFKFCKYHRMFLHYITLNLILNLIEWYIGIPFKSIEYLSLFVIVSFIFAFITLILYLKSK